jgi:predicted nucleotidyltransferase
MSRHREAFEDFAERAQEELGDSLEKLVLYGSVARGEEREDSDVDVFAVVEAEEDKRKLRDLAFETGLRYEVSFSPIVKTEEEYLDVKNTVYGKEVRSKGEAYV